MTASDSIADVAAWIAAASSVVAFTGAGISTESGIPDFRSPGGVWSRYQPVYYDEFLASASARHEYWRQKSEAHPAFAAARPNVAHEALARWESLGRLDAVITQNIDGLHQLAGSRRVLELHGTARRARCLDCSAEFDIDPLVAEFLVTDRVPPCATCGGRLKHATVSFGQQLPADTLREAFVLAKRCDLFIVVGSSLVVHPAAMLPQVAAEHQARLVIVNRDDTPLDAIASAVLRTPIGETLAEIDARLPQIESERSSQQTP